MFERVCVYVFAYVFARTYAYIHITIRAHTLINVRLFVCSCLTVYLCQLYMHFITLHFLTLFRVQLLFCIFTKTVI